MVDGVARVVVRPLWMLGRTYGVFGQQRMEGIVGRRGYEIDCIHRMAKFCVHFD